MTKKSIPFSKSIDVSADDRGIFVPFITNADKLTDNQLAIKRIYYVYNHGKNVIRGFHFHKFEWKYFIAVSGAIKVLAIDPDHSEKVYTFISSSRKPNLVVIPPGFANGWISLEDNTVLVCASTSTLEESIADDYSR
jgi:dTDP-4-dehydrorhamnose 3,5-epimerase-like enzyme